jgi:hypothetical protein
MLKNLILATAAVALTATVGLADSAGAKTAVEMAQGLQLKQAPGDTEPTRTPRATPAVPLGSTKLAPNPYVDLYGEPYYPAGIEGLPGYNYCNPVVAGNGTSSEVRVKVRNKGTKVAGPVQVVFEFGGGQSVKQTLPMNLLAATYVFEADIPAGAWQNGDVFFTIRIDHPNKVAESNEANNTISSYCLGPEG